MKILMMKILEILIMILKVKIMKTMKKENLLIIFQIKENLN
jgi:hypothetical protein